jgi:hypothetical protein
MKLRMLVCIMYHAEVEVCVMSTAEVEDARLLGCYVV